MISLLKGIPHGIRGFALSTFVAFGLGSGSAHAAQTITYAATVPLSATDWTHALDLPKFDPAFGVLRAVNITLDGSNESTTWVENQDTVPWNVVSGSDVALRVTDPAGAVLAAVAPSVRFSNQLSEFDGTLDFGGGSGVMNPTVTSSLRGRHDYAAATDDLSGFIGTGTLGYNGVAVGAGYYDGPGDYFFRVRTKASMTATVVYTYEPPAAIIPLGSIGDRVWYDCNANGTQDTGEAGLVGWTVQLVQGGVVTQTKVTGADGLYLFSGLAVGDYSVRVIAKTGYNETYDLDGLVSGDIASLHLNAGENRRDADFGYMTAPVGCATGGSPGYWSKKGLPLVKPADLAALSALRLVEDSGADADFTNPTTGAFGGGYGADLATARAAFGAYEAKGTAINMASQLSRQLAAFVLDLRSGEFASTTLMDCSAVPGGRIKASDLVALADNALRANPYTPAGNANRTYQETLKNALQSGYTTYAN